MKASDQEIKILIQHRIDKFFSRILIIRLKLFNFLKTRIYFENSPELSDPFKGRCISDNLVNWILVEENPPVNAKSLHNEIQRASHQKTVHGSSKYRVKS